MSLLSETLSRLYSEAAIGRLKDRPFDRAFRTELGSRDIEFFARYYFPEHFTHAPSPVHRRLFRAVQSAVSRPGRETHVFALPRGFGKSTITLLALPAWCICYQKRHFIPIISDSYDQAKAQLTTLKSELESNPRIIEDFGELKGEKWQEDLIVTSNGIQVIALGARQKIRGRKFGSHRPDLILLDDIENDVGVQSPTQRKALESWFLRSVTRAGWANTKIFLVGNFLHYDCLLKKCAENPRFSTFTAKAVNSFGVEPAVRSPLWAEWREKLINLDDSQRESSALSFFSANREEMLAGTDVTWPEAYSFYDLMLMWVTDGEASFNCELQNDPIDPESRFFRHWETFTKEVRLAADGYDTWLVPSNGRAAVRLADCGVFAYTDPSMGETNKSDYSAIIVLAKAPNKQQFVLEADIRRRVPSKIITDQIAWGQQYPVLRWGIEKTQFQAFFATESQHQSMLDDAKLNIVRIDHANSNKKLRIESLQPDLHNEYVLLAAKGQELLKQQLEQYPATTHDDGPDALEGARTMAQSWQPFIHAELMQGEVHKFQAHRSQPTRLVGPASNRDPYARHEAAFAEKQAAIAAAKGEKYVPADEAWVPQMFM